MESGACQIGIMAHAENSTKYGSAFADAVGCTGSKEDVRKCMLAKPAEDLIYPNGPNPDLQLIIPNPENYMNSLFPWGTTVDGTDGGVPDIPKFLLRDGKFPNVSVIFGTNDNEFQAGCMGPNARNLSSCSFINKIDYLMQRKIDLDDESDIHSVLNFVTFPGAGRWHNMSDSDFNKLVAAYPADQFPTGGHRLSAMLVDSNRWISHCATMRAAELIGAHTPNVWVYHFKFPGNPLLSGGLTGHGSEIPFVFHRCNALPLHAACQGAAANGTETVSKVFVDSWSSLARTGDPGAAWPRLGANRTFLKIGKDGGVPQTNYRSEYCALWESIDPYFSSPAGLTGNVIV